MASSFFFSVAGGSTPWPGVPRWPAGSCSVLAVRGYHRSFAGVAGRSRVSPAVRGRVFRQTFRFAPSLPLRCARGPLPLTRPRAATGFPCNPPGSRSLGSRVHSRAVLHRGGSHQGRDIGRPSPTVNAKGRRQGPAAPIERRTEAPAAPLRHNGRRPHCNTRSHRQTLRHRRIPSPPTILLGQAGHLLTAVQRHQLAREDQTGQDMPSLVNQNKAKSPAQPDEMILQFAGEIHHALRHVDAGLTFLPMLFRLRQRSRHALQAVVRHIYFTTELQNAASQRVRQTGALGLSSGANQRPGAWRPGYPGSMIRRYLLPGPDRKGHLKRSGPVFAHGGSWKGVRRGPSAFIRPSRFPICHPYNGRPNNKRIRTCTYFPF